MNANRRNTASGGRLVQIDAIKANGGHLLLQKPGPADQYIKVQKTAPHLDDESFSFLWFLSNIQVCTTENFKQISKTHLSPGGYLQGNHFQ